MKVKYGDKIKCRRVVGSDSIAVKAYGPGDRVFSASFMTAEQARRLARKLNQAASAIEIRERDLARYAR